METESVVASYISNRIRILGKPQNDIAAEYGFERPNIITMIKQGRTKLPLAKVCLMAKALEADPVHLLKLCLSEYQPENWSAIAPLLDLALTKDEQTLLNHFRDYVGAPCIKALTAESQKHLAKFLQSLRMTAVQH
jgi:hypothetical protein